MSPAHIFANLHLGANNEFAPSQLSEPDQTPRGCRGHVSVGTGGAVSSLTTLGVVYRAVLKQLRDVSHGHSSFSILWIAAWIFRRSDREFLAQTTLNRAFRF